MSPIVNRWLKTMVDLIKPFLSIKANSFVSLTMVFSLFFSPLHILSQEYKTNEEVHGLEVGANAPMFTAMDRHDSSYNLKDALKSGPVVLIFYRGQWCPVCNRHLSNIQDSLKLIYNKGASVIAVSPEKPEYLDEMAEKTGVQITLLYDEGYKISDAFDGTFVPSSKQRLVYNTWLGADLKNSHSDDSQRLPIPATYIIGQDGIIVWGHFDHDHHQRSSVEDIVNNL